MVCVVDLIGNRLAGNQVLDFRTRKPSILVSVSQDCTVDSHHRGKSGTFQNASA